MSSALLTNKAQDARSAMCALIEARSLSVREDDPEFPKHVAQLAWDIADAMQVERIRRSRGQK
jgi:hypothetical protein